MGILGPMLVCPITLGPPTIGEGLCMGGPLGGYPMAGGTGEPPKAVVGGGGPLGKGAPFIGDGGPFLGTFGPGLGGTPI